MTILTITSRWQAKAGVLVSAAYAGPRQPVLPNGTMLAMLTDTLSPAVDFAALTAQAGEAGTGHAYQLLSTGTSGTVLAIAERWPQWNKPELAALLDVAVDSVKLSAVLELLVVPMGEGERRAQQRGEFMYRN